MLMRRGPAAVAVMLAACLVGACAASQAPTAPASQSEPVTVGGSSQTATASVGEEIDVTLRTLGPGQFDSMPTLSSGAVQFAGAAIVPPYDPGGPRQQFRFTAPRPGTTVVTFTQVGRADGFPVAVVSDTFIVR